MLTIIMFLLSAGWPSYSSGSADTFIVKQWTLDDGMPVNSSFAALTTADGYTWITTYDGLVQFNGHELKVYSQANTPGIVSNRFKFMHEQPGVGLWIVKEAGGLLLYKGGAFTRFGAEQGISENVINALIQDKSGTFYVASDDGLFRYAGGRFTRAFDRGNNQKNRILDLYIDDLNTLWAATSGGLVALRDGEIAEYLTESEDPMSNWLFKVRKDPAERIIVTSHTGIYYLNEGVLADLPGVGFQPDFANAYLYADDQILLIGATSGTYAVHKNEELSKLGGVQLTLRNPLQYGYRDSNGTLWLTSVLGNLLVYNNGELAAPSFLNALQDAAAYNITEDKRGNLWVTSKTGGFSELPARISEPSVFPRAFRETISLLCFMIPGVVPG